ncbi:MAG TPA: GNAT family N-acetyltransferase [Candidatus Obscuribacterales bacterium]
MDQSITYELVDSLQPLPDEQWNLLFAGHPDTGQMIRLMSSCKLEGFKLQSIVAHKDGQPLVLLPLFQTRYSIATTLDQPARKLVASLEKWIPSLLCPRVIGVGFVEGEWGEIGINREFPEATINEAVAGALEFLEKIAEGLDVQILALKDFRAETLRRLPKHIEATFGRGVSLPFCRMKLDFGDVEDYLNGLPRRVRQDLRRKMRQSTGVQVEIVTDPGQWLDKIYDLYRDQVERSDLSLGMHGKEYFARVCAAVPGARYVLFILDNELIGFNLIVDNGNCLIDKYIGMDQTSGRANNVYFLAFLEKVRYCTTHGIKLLHLGAAAEGVKVRLGAYAISSYVLFHHRNPIVNMILSRLTGVLSYKPEVECVADELQSASARILAAQADAPPACAGRGKIDSLAGSQPAGISN